jgi:hypothetical protein
MTTAEQLLRNQSRLNSTDYQLRSMHEPDKPFCIPVQHCFAAVLFLEKKSPSKPMLCLLTDGVEIPCAKFDFCAQSRYGSLVNDRGSLIEDPIPKRKDHARKKHLPAPDVCRRG